MSLRGWGRGNNWHGLHGFSRILFLGVFYQVQKMVLEYQNGFQDTIHSSIMRNNGIGMILTGDGGLEGVEGIEVVNPLKDWVLDNCC